MAAVDGLGVGLAIAVQGRNLQPLATLALTLSAATVLPACLYSLFWCRYNRTGLHWTLYGGIACTTVLYVFSLAFSGRPDSLLPGRDIAWIGLHSTAVLAIPMGCLLGWAGSTVERRGQDTNPGSGDAPRRVGVLAQ